MVERKGIAKARLNPMSSDLPSPHLLGLEGLLYSIFQSSRIYLSEVEGCSSYFEI